MPKIKRAIFYLMILVLFANFSLWTPVSTSADPPGGEAGPIRSPELSVEIYKGLTGLNPDETASAWLLTHKTPKNLTALASYLLDLVYNRTSPEQLSANLYTAVTGLTPDETAREWLLTHKSRENLKQLAEYLINLQSQPPAPTPTPTPVLAPALVPESSIVCDARDISIPVLMYHYIAPPGAGANDYWSTSSEEFYQQMNWLKDNNYSSITADELYDFMATGKIKNPRSFLPIFDDNWYGSIKNRVLPLMTSLGFKPTLALYTDAIYNSGENVFTWRELADWQKTGLVDVQSHSVSHPLNPAMTQLSDSDLWYELNHSRLLLEQNLQKPITAFITPGGSVDERVRIMAREAGYKTFFLLWESGGMKYGDNPFNVYRVNMVNTLDIGTFTDKMIRYSTPINKCGSGTANVQSQSSSILDNNQVVAYYGHPYTALMGILGEYSAQDLVPILQAKAREYDAMNGDKGVIPAFHIIFGTVQPEGRIGIIDEPTLLKYIEIAKQNNMLVILDHQIGRGSAAEAISQMLPYLKYDNVHLAIDPEWHTALPMQEIGGISGYDVNAVQDLMQRYMEENNIPGKKILIVHQFMSSMIIDREVVSANYSRVDLVHDADGFGQPPTKKSEYDYNKLAVNIPLKAIKLFYPNSRGWGYDDPLMTPEEVLSLEPQPVIIIYQ